MSFTKVAPAGIGTEPGDGYRIGDSFLHSTGVNLGSGTTISHSGSATFTGIITAANISAASSVTATEFYGDGSNLDGVSSSGIGTALNDDDTNVLNKIYYVNQELSIGSTVTVNHPDTGTASYTHYQDLVVKNDADFIVADGDTFIPDILGITTSTLAASAATGGRIRAGTITNAGANGAPNFPNGLTGTAGTFTGNLNVAGVLTYEDVTNVDSVGVITARDGLRVTGIATISGDLDIADKIIHTGDTNTALRFPAADTITAETGGSERLRITSAGDVGMDISPANYSNYKTFTVGAGAVGSIIELRGTTSNFEHLLQNNNGDLVFEADLNNVKASTNVIFKVDGSERLRIDSNGNVTKPTNFHILVQRSGNQTGYNASSLSAPVIWNSVVTGESSTGASSHFNTSTGLFTAPVTGMYHFHASVNCNFDCEGGWIILDGSRPSYAAFYPNNTQSADGHLIYHITAGQTVGLKWYDNGNTNATINANTHHTWWRIILLG